MDILDLQIIAGITRKLSWFFHTTLVVIFMGCSTESQINDVSKTNGSVEKMIFGSIENENIYLFVLTNTSGIEMKVTNYGGIITSFKTPDKNGILEDIVLGYDSLEHYIANNSPYFGAIIGRYGNRISKGKFTINENEYQLAANNNGNHLHGGLKGFDKVVWTANEQTFNDGVGIKLIYLSRDGEEGYPGNLNVEVTYKLGNDNSLMIFYTATTEKPTIINLTQHTYFNLSGDFKEDILNHKLTLNSGIYLPVDETLIPTGELRSVTNTAFDFTAPHLVGERINDDDDQITIGLGYDHCWIIDKSDDITQELTQAATLYHEASGRVMDVYTSEPALQFYSGNFLDGTITGKQGVTYSQRFGLCLETQHYPDSPNQAGFPSTLLAPGEVYETTTIYKFSTE